MPNLLKNLLAIAFGLGMLLAVEGLLALVGISPLVEEDPFVGFSQSAPLFVENGASRYSLNPVKERFFNQQAFAMPKPDGRFRIVAFGGSTTYGRPYLDDTSFIAWFSKLLARYDRSRTYDRINAGGISYASYRAGRLLEELNRFSPDLYVVYSGHNEFLEARTYAGLIDENPVLRKVRRVLHHSRLYSLLNRGINRLRTGSTPPTKTALGGEVMARLEEVGGPDLYHRDPLFRQGVIRQYRHSIQQMVASSKKRGIPLILCTLPSNLSGISPFKSEHREQLKAEELMRWNEAFAQAENTLLSGRPEVALTYLATAEKIDQDYALLHYRKGQALQMLGRFKQAYAAFVRAKQEDIVPLRALEEFNQILREVAAAEQVPLADVAAMFKRVSPDGIPGNNLFVDHVHPSIEGQQLVAWVIMDTAAKWGLVPVSKPRWQRQVVDAREYLRNALADISPRYQAMGLWGVGRLYFWAGKYPEAHVALLDAWQSVKDIPEIPMKLGMLELYRGAGEKALEYLLVANGMEPDNTNVRLAMANAYRLLRQEQKALEIVDSFESDERRNHAFYSVKGKAMMSLGREQEGLDALEQAVQAAPEVAAYRLDLAIAMGKSGRLDQAASHYLVYLEMVRRPAPEHELTEWLAQFRGDE